jgi:hypothetical protein
VNSLVSLAVRSLFIVTGPILGWALDEQGMQGTLLFLAALFAPLLIAVSFSLGLRIRKEHLGLALPPAVPLNGPRSAA